MSELPREPEAAEPKAVEREAEAPGALEPEPIEVGAVEPSSVEPASENGEPTEASDAAQVWESDSDWERDRRRERIEAERAAEAEAAAGSAADGHDVPTLARVIEGLLFLSPDPVPAAALAEATGATADDTDAALALLDRQYAPGERGLILKRVAGGITLATDPICEPAARALLSTQRIPPLTAAQAETLAIVAYLQPVARPEISRIRGVAADSATATLLERGLIEEAGRSDFGAILYRTTDLFLRLFGLDSLSALPDVSTWDPAPEEEDELRERLLRAGGARSGSKDGGPAVELPEPRELDLSGERSGAAHDDGSARGTSSAEGAAPDAGGDDPSLSLRPHQSVSDGSADDAPAP